MTHRLSSLVPLVGLLLSAGCFAPRLAASYPRDALRTPQGACAWGDGGRICAQTGAPNTLADDGVTPLALVYVQDWGGQLSNTGNWQLTITRPDGTVAVQQVLKDQIPNLGAYVSGAGYLHWSIDGVRLPEPWSAGTYKFDLVCTFNVQIRRHYEITFL